MTNRRSSLVPLCLAALLAWPFAGCSKNVTRPPAANPPPAAVTTLAVQSLTAGELTLAWTAPGADGSRGTATAYDVRYGAAAITSANWGDASQVTSEPVPHAAGSAETCTITGLPSGTPCFVALKTRDEIPTNWSGLSNVVSATPSSNAPPAAVTSLAIDSVTVNSITLAWVAPGADGSNGTATAYDVRTSTQAITPANWVNATPATDAPRPHAAGSSETFTIGGLTSNQTYYVALKTRDEIAGHWSSLSNVVSATPAYCSPPASAMMRDGYWRETWATGTRGADLPCLDFGAGADTVFLVGQDFFDYFIGNSPACGVSWGCNHDFTFHCSTALSPTPGCNEIRTLDGAGTFRVYDVSLICVLTDNLSGVYTPQYCTNSLTYAAVWIAPPGSAVLSSLRSRPPRDALRRLLGGRRGATSAPGR